MSIFSFVKDTLNKSPTLLEISSHLYNFIGFNKSQIKGKNNKIKKGISFFRKLNTQISGSNNSVVFGEKCHLINCKIYMFGDNNKITISDKVYLKDTELYIQDDNNEISIGNKTTILGKTHLACIEGKKIIIGNDCMFSKDVVFRTGDSHSIIDSSGSRVNYSKDILVGNHVWFGNKTIVIKGVHIPDNSIVGTGSVVTKQFIQEGVVLAGNPAKVIKENINWLRERI